MRGAHETFGGSGAPIKTIGVYVTDAREGGEHYLGRVPTSYDVGSHLISRLRRSGNSTTESKTLIGRLALPGAKPKGSNDRKESARRADGGVDFAAARNR